MSRPIYIFAGGATGGHLYPAIAVADELKRLQPEAQIVFACSHYDIDKRVLSSRPYACIPQPIRPLPKRVEMIPGFLGSLLSSWHLAKSIVSDLQPRAVVGTGAFVAVPVTLCSAKAGIPTALINIDAVAGRANRHLARKVEVVFVQFERTGDTLPRSARVVKVGCPVRRELLQGNAEEARRVWELSPHRKTLLIMAGSLGARNINQAVAAIADDLDELADDWQVLHICGPGKRADLEGKVGKKIRHVIMEYCQWMALAYAVSDLVLARAGASTIGELAALSKPAVLMPYRYHTDRQQYLNAQELAHRGAGVIVEDTGDVRINAAAIRETLLEIMRNPERLEVMRRAARGDASSDAAEKIARWMLGKGLVECDE